MEKDLEEKLEEFRKSVSKTGEDIVFRTFPSKVTSPSSCILRIKPVYITPNRYSLLMLELRELGEVIQSAQHPDSPFDIALAQTSTDTTVYPTPSTPTSFDEAPAKKRKIMSGDADVTARTDLSLTAANNIHSARFTNLILSNHHISEKIHHVIKKEAEQLIESVDQVKLWVTLTMPKIEDGDNFGVQIQEEVLGELHRAQESAYNLRDAARQDHLARAKLCSKLVKYPHVEDYTLALQEHDEKQIYLARQHLYDIRNMYAVLTDLIHKNISKIRAPKANNSVGLY